MSVGMSIIKSNSVLQGTHKDDADEYMSVLRLSFSCSQPSPFEDFILSRILKIQDSNESSLEDFIRNWWLCSPLVVDFGVVAKLQTAAL